jgi:hypothetical protein
MELVVVLVVVVVVVVVVASWFMDYEIPMKIPAQSKVE